MRLLSARYFKFMIKSWNFVRTFLSSFLEKILKRASLEITKTLTSTLFFLSKPQQSIYHWKENLVQIQLCKRIKEMYISWDISCWLTYIIMRIWSLKTWIRSTALCFSVFHFKVFRQKIFRSSHFSNNIFDHRYF